MAGGTRADRTETSPDACLAQGTGPVHSRPSVGLSKGPQL